MDSPLANQLKQDLIDIARCLTPKQRLEAFAEHSLLLVQLKTAGERYRASLRKAPPVP